MHSNGSRVRRAGSLFLTAALLAVAFASVPSASAQSVDRRLARARAQQASAREAVRSAERDLGAILEEFRSVQERLAEVSVQVVSSYEDEERLTAELADAQATLDRRATEAYEAGGPMAALELFLGSSSPADFASAQEFAARAFTVDERTVSEVPRLRTALARITAQREARQRELAAAAERLDGLATRAATQLETAREKARRAGLTVDKMEREQRALREAEAAAHHSLDGLVDPSRGKDQSRLLALLGPTGGRTCKLPPGLRDTGQKLAGESSWYGWDFAGQRTASGAIFDPRLFTLANKELPLGAFLRIHFKDKCAIALVNDRGPYGVPGRIFDVAEAVAAYLGYKGAGVAQVRTDILVPA